MLRLVISSRLAVGLGVALPIAALVSLTSPDLVGAQVIALRHAAKSTTKWTQISKPTGLGIASPGLFRTSDGRLHVIWPSADPHNVYSLHYSTVGGKAKVLATGTVVSHWAAVDAYPRLAPGKNGGMVLFLDGGNGIGGSPYNTGAMYVATSNSAGKSWKLLPGSIAHSGFVPLTNSAGTTELNGTPVAAWTEINSLAYHVGIDPASPATSPDQHLGIGAAGGLGAPTLVTTKSGTILAGWFNTTGNDNEGYWVAQIWPKQGAKIKAPNSGSKSQTNGEPDQPVALVAHPAGGSYLAYCMPTHVLHCGHVALWRVGAAKTLTVPGSSSGAADLVSLAVGHGGHLWVSWFNTRTNTISVVRTNAAVTAFGQVRTISAPSPLFTFSALATLGGSGPLDVIALETLNHPNSSPTYFDTQLFPALRIKANKAKVSNARSTTITFTVDDSGDGVGGVTVKFLGHSAKTNSKGVVKFTVKKGTAKGSYVVTATKTGYAPASFTVKVT
jgi:hypothetical protein